MAYAYSTNIQNRIALTFFGVPYASLASADQKTHIDGTWSSGALATGMAFDALTTITQVANWFEQLGSGATGSAPQVWERWHVAETCLLLAQTYRPDRAGVFTAEREAAIDACLDSFTLRDPTGTFSSANLSQATTVNGLRFYVLNHCARRKESGVNSGLRRRIFPPIDEVDSHIQWTLNYVYNKEKWNFRKRPVQVVVNYLAAPTAATWTESTLTLTQTGAFSTITGPTRLLVTAGTNALTGTYQVLSSTSDTLVLATSLSATAGNLSTGDITGKVHSFDIHGMLTGETFDSIASRRFYFNQTQGYGAGAALEWTDATTFDMLKVRAGLGSGRPTNVRTELQPAGVVSWHLTPFPDQAYTLQGSVYIKGPGTPASASATTVFSAFPAEFFPVLRDMVLARVLQQYGASDSERVWGRAIDSVATLLPTFTDQGAPTRLAVTEDVYNDAARMLSGSAFPGAGAGWGWVGGGLT